MPIYEYRCEACGRLHEVLQKVSDKPLKACPDCRKRALKRLMSAPRFRLKGAGWYETDFKSDKEKKRNLAESGGDGGASAGDAAANGASSGDQGGKADKGDTADKSGGKAAEAKSGGKGSDKAQPAGKSKTASRRSGGEAA